MSKIITVKDLKDALSKIPDDRDDDLIAVWIDNDGTRHNISHIDELVDGTIDISIGEINIDKKVDKYEFGNHDTTVRLPNGRFFYCHCGCNVFRKSACGDFFKCNACSSIHEGS